MKLDQDSAHQVETHTLGVRLGGALGGGCGREEPLFGFKCNAVCPGRLESLVGICTMSRLHLPHAQQFRRIMYANVTCAERASASRPAELLCRS